MPPLAAAEIDDGSAAPEQGQRLPDVVARAIDHEIKLQVELIELKKKEFDTIKAKYDADRKRFFELTRRPPSGSAAQPR